MINRWFKDFGIAPLLGFLILAIVFSSFAIFLFNKTSFANYILVICAIVLINKLAERKRNDFLKSCYTNVFYKKIRILENLICAAPFLIFLCYKYSYAAALLLVVIATILAFFNFRTNLNYTIWTPFAKTPFEFTIGFRNTFHSIFIAYALTAIAVYTNNFNLGAAALLLLLITTTTYYTKPENEYYVWIYALTPTKFLQQKIKKAILFSALLAIPIATSLVICFAQNFHILLIVFLLAWAFLIAAIVSKYANYPDELNITQSILVATCIWFPPILIVSVPYLFYKSKLRISYLLK